MRRFTAFYILPFLLASLCVSAASLAQVSRSPAQPRSTVERLSAAAREAREANHNEEAIHLYRRALTLQPAWKEGLWFLGILLHQQKQYPEARDVLRRFVAEEPEAGAGWAILGLCEFQTREYSRALEHLQRARSLGLGDRKEIAQAAVYYLSLLLSRFERYDDAMTLLFGMAKSGASSDLLTEPAGIAALRQPFLPSEIPGDRRELFRTAGEGVLAEEAQKRDEAERVFASMAAAYPQEPGVHFLYGVFLLDLRPDDGVAQLRRELEISPYNFTAKLRLADEYLKEQKLDEAQQLAEEVLKLEPDYASGQLVLGEALMAKGDPVRGIAALETSRKLRPETVRTHWDLLRAYTSAGRTEDAQREKQEIEKLRRPNAQP